MPNITNLRRWLAVCAAAFAVTGNLIAQSDILYSNTFEDASMDAWTNIGADAGLYLSNSIVGNMGAGDELINYAPTGDYSLWDGNGGSSYLSTKGPLLLATKGYTNLTIRFKYSCRNASGTRKLYTHYVSAATTQSLGYVTATGSQSYSLDSGSYSFADEAKFHLYFQDGGGSAGPFFVDDIVITASPVYVTPPPEGTVLIVK